MVLLQIGRTMPVPERNSRGAQCSTVQYRTAILECINSTAAAARVPRENSVRRTIREWNGILAGHQNGILAGQRPTLRRNYRGAHVWVVPL